MAGSAERPKRRFPDAPDFVGRYVREAFMYLMAEVNEGVRERYPDVTPALSRVMTLLDRDGTRVGDLAERAQLTKQSLSELVVSLENIGLVERRPDPTDGRAKLVVPTAEGKRAMVVGFEVAQAVHRRWARLLGPDDMSDLMRLLGQLISALSEQRS